MSYVAGHTPSAEDEAVAAAFAAAGIVPACDALKGFSNISRWLRNVLAFAPAERAAWAITRAQALSGAVDARKSMLFA